MTEAARHQAHGYILSELQRVANDLEEHRNRLGQHKRQVIILSDACQYNHLRAVDGALQNLLGEPLACPSEDDLIGCLTAIKHLEAEKIDLEKRLREAGLSVAVSPTPALREAV